MPGANSTAPYLVVAASGRALARSASRAGIPVVVLDLFDDVDTRALAFASGCVAGASLRLHSRKLLAAAAALCPVERCAGLVTASGFESRPQLLAQLARGRYLAGNAPATLTRVKDPVAFFGFLDQAGIAHPEVCLDAPEHPQGWLTKRVGGAGGLHVKPTTARHRARPGRYFQRRDQGRSLSVLFAANGRDARILGFNEQWHAPGPRNPWRYGGAASVSLLPAQVAARMTDIVSAVARGFALVGLNGLDFLLDSRGEVRVLEVNPRPTATLDLHDGDFAQGLFAIHLDACAGRLPAPRRAHRARAHAIVYAVDPLRVPAALQWPAWCTDLPRPGSVIAAGAPICSVHAEARDAQGARALVLRRRDELLSGLARSAA